MYRKQDLSYLQSIFNRDSNDIMIVYGKDSYMLKDLYSHFVKNKVYFYYNALDVELSLQGKIFANELNNKSILPPYINEDYDSFFYSYLEENSNTKKVIIIDNFTFLLFNYPTFINNILNVLSDRSPKGSVLFILSTSNHYWVENEMLNFLGKNAYELSTVFKIEPLSLNDCFDEYKGVNKQNIYLLYSAFGHRSSIWDNIDVNNYKNSIIKLLDNKNSILFLEGDNLLPKELRNPTVYNTILYCIANDADKIGSIYDMCHIDKSKLSVYIKTLLKYNLLYRKESVSLGNDSNIEKGHYAITDPFVKFWFHYIVPNYSILTFTSGDKFYKELIESTFSAYSEQYFVYYCKLMLEKNNVDNFSIKTEKVDFYYDKTNSIDLILTSNLGEIILCKCSMSKIHLTYRAFEGIKSCAEKNHIDYKKILLISPNGFDQKLMMTRRIDDSLYLLDKELQFNHVSKNGVK